MSSKKEMNLSVASEIELLMKGVYGDGVQVGGGDVVTTTIEPKKFQELPIDIYKDILLCLANENDYPVPDEPTKPKEGCDKRQLSKYKNKMRKRAGGFGLKRRAMMRKIWQMRNVCEGFRKAYDVHTVMSNTERQDFPRPTIGLRISPKPGKTTHIGLEGGEVMVILNIYGDPSRDNFSHCVHPHDIADTIFPCVVSTHLTLQGFVVDDGLIDTLKLFDTSQVEEVYINDIKCVDLEEYSVEDLVNLFPNAMEIRFLGDTSVESLKNLSVSVPDMEIEQLHDIKTGELIKMYHTVDPKIYDRNRYNRNRKVFMRELKNRGDPQEKKVDKENIIGSIMRMKRRLNEDNTKKAKDGMVDIGDLDLSSTGADIEERNAEAMEEEYW